MNKNNLQKHIQEPHDVLCHGLRKRSSEDALKCENCGAKSGDKSKVVADMKVNVRQFHGHMLCSDCEDGLCYALEH